MYSTTLQTVGESVLCVIPTPLLSALSLHENQPVELSIEDGRMIVTPLQRPRYELSDLISKCDLTEEFSDDDVAWLNDNAVGQEII